MSTNCTHEWSLTLRSSTEVIFGHETLSFMTGKGQIRSRRRKSRPRVTERNGPELSSVDQKVFVIVLWLFSDSGFYFSYSIRGYSCVIPL